MLCRDVSQTYCYDLLPLQVSVWWGDACSKFQEVAGKYGPIEFLLIDGVPKEALAYLQAAEPFLAEGALIVADNAGEWGT